MGFSIKQFIMRPLNADKSKIQWFTAIVTGLIALALVKPFGFTLVNLSTPVLGTTWGVILGVLLAFIAVRSKMI